MIWDIQNRHLDEAEFLLEMWSKSLDSPQYTLAKLAEGPEDRFLAHVRALLVGREQVLERLLIPALEGGDEDEFRIAAATFTILAGAGGEACERVRAGLDHPDSCPASVRGLVCGLSLSGRAGLIPWLAHDLERVSGPGLAARLRVLAGHRVDAGARLIPWLSASELEVRQAAAHLARHTSDPQVLRHLDPLMHSDDHELRWSALESGVIRGLQGAWERVSAEAFAPRSREHHSRALGWLAMLGDHSAHQQVVAALRSPTPSLLAAANLTGKSEAVDLAVELLDHPQLARLAGELVSAVAGLAVHDDRFWLDNGARPGKRDDAPPELEHDDLDADLIPPQASKLRLPNPGPVRRWWGQSRSRFEPRLRYSRGRPLDGAQLRRDLLELPTRRRHHRALELGARTAGMAQIQTRSLTHVQAAQLDAHIPLLARLDLQCGHSLQS